MKALQTITVVAGLLFAANTFAQSEELQDATLYKTELFGSVASGTNTPFWMVSNRYGIVPMDANNAYLRAGVFHQQHFGKGFHWSAGLDLVAAVPRYHNVFIQQAYAELGYKSLLLSIGSKENRHSLWDHSLSSGDLVLSPNARPIPEINLSMPAFTNIPFTQGWTQIKFDFAVGKSFDAGYLAHVSNGIQTYVENTLWHHKSLYLQIKDTKGDFPLSFIAGAQHWAQWGGTSSDPKVGVQPRSFKDFLRIVSGKEGGANATVSDQANVLGNHYGTYDFKLEFTQPSWKLAAYYQHYFDDKSGMEFTNGTDGLWGAQLDLPRLPWLQKVVTEYLVTLNQSGPLHFIWFDPDKYKGPGGGFDNYYNNGEYQTGVSNFGRGLGSPLLPAPEYNTNGDVNFKHNRIRAWHLAFEGDLSSQVSYRLKYTYSRSWGTSMQPLLNVHSSNSSQIEIKYHHPRLQGWEFGGAVAGDVGKLYGDNIGFSLSVSKRGILKAWR